jgi:hypothetical protein
MKFTVEQKMVSERKKKCKMFRIRIGSNADPDPAFYVNADPDSALYVNADPVLDPDANHDPRF